MCFTAKKIEINRGSDMYVKWEGVQGEKRRGGWGERVKESTIPRTGMRRGRLLWKNGTFFIYLV